jgi:hypothetical protein
MASPKMFELAVVITVVGLLAITASGWQRRMKNWNHQRSQLRTWRKQHGLRQTKAQGEPPTPFQVRTKLGDQGDPRTGVSTQDTDNLFAALRRLFRDRKKGT